MDTNHCMPPEIQAALAALQHARFVGSPTVAVNDGAIKWWNPKPLSVCELRMQDAAAELLASYFRSARVDIYDADPDDDGEDEDDGHQAGDAPRPGGLGADR